MSGGRAESPSKCLRVFVHEHNAGRQDAALHGRRDACRYTRIKKTGLVSQGVTEKPGEFSN
jgi:hypothetical protein